MMISCGSDFDTSAYTFDTFYTLIPLNYTVDRIYLTFLLLSFDAFHAFSLIFLFC